MGYRKVACVLQKGPSRIRLSKGLSVVFLNWKTSNNKLAEEQNEYKFKWEKSLYVKCVEKSLVVKGNMSCHRLTPGLR
jgi:hypothetical protein